MFDQLILFNLILQGSSSIATIKVLEESPDPICLFTLIYTMFTYNHIHLYYLKL